MPRLPVSVVVIFMKVKMAKSRIPDPITFKRASIYLTVCMIAIGIILFYGSKDLYTFLKGMGFAILIVILPLSIFMFMCNWMCKSMKSHDPVVKKRLSKFVKVAATVAITYNLIRLIVLIFDQ